jgi:hypothetical protein
MLKILLAIDAISSETGALEFGCYLGRLTKSKLTGVFLENLEAEERPVLKRMHGLTYVDWEVDEKMEGHRARLELIDRNINLFKEGCINMEIGFCLHRDRGVPTRELLTESRFADLLIIGADTSFNKKYRGQPSEFVKDILKRAECPVIIAPEKNTHIDEIIFTYNGSASSLFAIKQFTYLFPQFHNKKVSIIQVNESGEWLDPDKYKFKEWLKEHYEEIQFEALQGNTDAKLFEVLLQRKNIFLVMGAYGRNALSQFFKRNHADLLIRKAIQPVFITHL